MERKTTRRIIGVLVVIALVIILLPLMFNGNDGQTPTPIKTAEVTPPPFPEAQTTTPPAPTASATQAKTTETVAENTTIAQAPYQSMMKKIMPTTTTTMETTTAAATTSTATTHLSPLAKAVMQAQKPDLAMLKKIAWVVQMGSFRDKNNAKRLTDSLRAKGYKAFTYETKSNGQTRVYVGPEGQQASASTLASKIEQEINMRGIVVSYKPLEL